MTFNLVDRPFIPASTMDGQLVELSLSQIFEQSPTLKEIRDSSPLATAAIHRFLVAIIHSAIRGPGSIEAWSKIWEAGKLPMAEIKSYLEKYRNRFDLCDQTHPFFQDQTLKAKQANPISRLAKELATGNNATLFDHSCETRIVPLPASKIARLLIAEQAFAVGGGKSDTGYTTNGPLVGGVVLTAIGENLFQTLLLNLQIYRDRKPIPSFEGDQPVWEVDVSSQPAVPRGFLDLLTWQCRTIRVHFEIDTGEPCASWVDYAQGRKFAPDETFLEPFMPYRNSKDRGWMPVRFEITKALWRSSGALFKWSRNEGGGLLHHLSQLAIQKKLPPGRHRKLAAIGICNDKARVDLWRHDTIPLRDEYLSDETLLEGLDQALELAEQVGTAIRAAGWLSAKETLKTGVSEPDKDRVSNLFKSHAPDRLFWANVEVPFLQLLIDLPDCKNRTDRLRVWFEPTLKQLARAALRETFGQCSADPRELRGFVQGESHLDGELCHIRKKHFGMVIAKESANARV